jgi:hypothetical protein
MLSADFISIFIFFYNVYFKIKLIFTLSDIYTYETGMKRSAL